MHNFTEVSPGMRFYADYANKVIHVVVRPNEKQPYGNDWWTENEDSKQRTGLWSYQASDILRRARELVTNEGAELRRQLKEAEAKMVAVCQNGKRSTWRKYGKKVYKLRLALDYPINKWMVDAFGRG